jgi:CTP:molybdopterin cytidylyltransferase MocA
MKIGCILLASGSGERFGGNKLCSLAGGTTLFSRALGVFPAELFAVRAVTSRYEPFLEEGRAAGWLPLYNPDAAEGISAGIRLGLRVMDGMDGVLFAVSDQPWLTGRSVARLADAFAREPSFITALSFRGKKGNPVIFPRDLFPELLKLTGDTGGSAVIRNHPDRLRLVEAADGRELRDVDTPGDL